MNVIILLILVSLVLASGFLLCFIWAVRSGQFEDACTPGLRPLLDDCHRPPSSQDPSHTEK